jgi:hypothetical protein
MRKCQKRPIYLTKEAYSYDKRSLLRQTSMPERRRLQRRHSLFGRQSPVVRLPRLSLPLAVNSCTMYHRCQYIIKCIIYDRM